MSLNEINGFLLIKKFVEDIWFLIPLKVLQLKQSWCHDLHNHLEILNYAIFWFRIFCLAKGFSRDRIIDHVYPPLLLPFHELSKSMVNFLNHCNNTYYVIKFVDDALKSFKVNFMLFSKMCFKFLNIDLLIDLYMLLR